MRTLQRWKKGNLADNRKKSHAKVIRKLTDDECENIVSVSTSGKYKDLSPHKIVPLLLSEGIYIASVRSFYRILGKYNMNNHRSNSKAKKNRSKPPEIKASESNQVWCWDITWLPCNIKGKFFYAYVIIDVYDRSIVGWSVHSEESEIHSYNLFRYLTEGKNITFKNLHSDNGSPMKGSTLISFLNSLEVGISFSRPRVSNDNPFIESFFKTLKYDVSYPYCFDNICSARSWVADFVNWYNTEHLHSAIGYVTPEQMRSGDAEQIFEQRNEVMRLAKESHPERWGTRDTKRWSAPETVILNPDNRFK